MSDSNRMKKRTSAHSINALIFVFALLFLNTTAFAESYVIDSDETLYATVQLLAAPAGYPLVNGEVRKVDLSSQKITIRHEEIANLDMPPMTMVFKAVSLEMLDSVAAGAKVRFVADSINGQMTVLWLEVL
jgi:Cu(I)/Ag(I) efflux system protein CusF